MFHLPSFSPNIWRNALNNILVLRILPSVYCWKELRQPKRLTLQRCSLCFVWVLFAPVFELCAAFSWISYCSRIGRLLAREAAPPPHLFSQRRHVTHCNCNTRGWGEKEKKEKRKKSRSWKDANITAGCCVPTGGLLVRELLFFIIPVLVRSDCAGRPRRSFP